MRLQNAVYIAFIWFARHSLASPPVHVELRTSWPSAPALLEVLEVIAVEQPGSFFSLLDAVTNPEALSDPPPKNTEQIYQYAINTAFSAGYLAGPGAFAAVEAGLALHTPVPKIEAFYQYYLDQQVSRRGHEASEHSKCGSWVDWYGQVVCDVQTLSHLTSVESIDPPSGIPLNLTHPRPNHLAFDHINPDPSRSAVTPPYTAILYASLSSSNLRELHEHLYKLSAGPSPHVQYIFRPIPEEGRDETSRTYLSGYGVALDLKKMDYLALDDRRQNDSGPEDSTTEQTEHIYDTDPVVSLIQQYPDNTTADYTAPLTEDELWNIGIQATQLVYDSKEPLQTLKQLSQNFPKYASILARRVVPEQELQDEIHANQVKAQGGVSMAWLNGVMVNEKDMNPFSLLRILRKERGIIQSLMSLGLTGGQAVELVSHDAINTAQSGAEVLDGVFDASDRPEDGGVIVWWNNFEKDARYARWGDSLHLMLRPMYPGQFPSIKRNIFNAVVIADLSQGSTLNFIAGAISNIISRSFPIRWGIVPIVETEDGTKMAKLFYWMIQHVGRAKTMELFKSAAQLNTPVHQLLPTVDWKLLRSEFTSMLASIEEPSEAVVAADFDAILKDTAEDVIAALDKAKAYAKRLGADLEAASQGHTFINGKHFDLDDDFLRNMQMEVGQQMQYLQEQLYLGKLSDEVAATIDTYFYDLPTTAKRRNKVIYPSGKEPLSAISLPELHVESGLPGVQESFIYPPGDGPIPLSTYVVADFDSLSGLELAKRAILSLSENSISRLSFIHNPSTASAVSKEGRTNDRSSLLGNLILKGTLYEVTPVRLLKALGLEATPPPDTKEQIVIAEAEELKLLNGIDSRVYFEYLSASQLAVRKLKLQPGEQALIVNGRVLKSVQSNDFAPEDIEELMVYEFRKRVAPVEAAVQDILSSSEPYSRESLSEIVSMASSVITDIQIPDPSEAGLFNTPYRPRRRGYQLLDGQFTRFASGNNATALLQFGFLLDPLSEVAQKWSGIIEWLLNDPAVFVEVYINPPKYRDLPLKRFYRYNLPAKIAYDENGYEIQSRTVFNNLPVEPIYTLAMDVAPSWLARPREAQYDLDNIQLGVLSGSERSKGISATFDLDYLVIEGHAREVLTNAPPRGVQMQLTAFNSSAIADTLVMANLGYLQFRTKPGVFNLEIRPGKGQAIYAMESVGNEGWDSPSIHEVGDDVTLTSFEGLTLYPRLSRKPGMEKADVLADDEVDGDEPKGLFDGVVSSFSSMFSKHKQSPETALTVSDHADINIFTVASGLLYERFASIMILSVLRNTKSTVKFWFIENFLSPSFLEFIPHFAEAYNFKYELVTYKWPSFLRSQKEKQRIIWAYKILFLDVLFPMDLKKVIFVDADQIVRADLLELVNLDLHGAPYGYTPMGDDNTDMEGFRFWKTGYWKEFLQGLPYHISALYVVDLVRFRQIAAGDILRGHYQQLSADPNSLANLDQDLPNNLQREVPIFSLPEDWLWCETWCSKDRLSRAKTIDLCQNPLTKEPKLSRARQIPEWSTYDAEISKFASSLAERGVIRSGIVAADANVLADAAVNKLQAEDAAEHDGEVSEDDHKSRGEESHHPKDEL